MCICYPRAARWGNLSSVYEGIQPDGSSDCLIVGPIPARPALAKAQNLLVFFCFEAKRLSVFKVCRLFPTCQLGEDDLFHYGRQQAVISVSFLQSSLLIKPVEKQRLEPQHVLKIVALPLDRRKEDDYIWFFPLACWNTSTSCLTSRGFQVISCRRTKGLKSLGRQRPM